MDFNITDSPMANKKATDRVATESAGLRASSSHPYSQTNDFRKSPEFFLTLGSLYLQQNLLDEAEEVLVRILPDHNLYVNATEVLIEVHSRKQNFQEVLRLGKQLQNSVSDPLWLAHQVGAAYYSLDEPIEAKPHFVKALSFIPEKTRLRSILKSLQPGTRCPNIKTLIRESVPFGITPHVVLDCLVPLLWGGHPASCCFADQLSFFNSTNISDPNLPKRFSLVAAYLYHQFGIYTAFLPYVEFSHKAGTPLVKIYLSLRSSLMDEVAEIEQSAWDGFEKQGGESKGRLEYLGKEGSLLGYPKCCMQWAVNNRVNNRTIERIALAALIEEECCSSTR